MVEEEEAKISIMRGAHRYDDVVCCIFITFSTHRRMFQLIINLLPYSVVKILLLDEMCLLLARLDLVQEKWTEKIVKFLVKKLSRSLLRWHYKRFSLSQSLFNSWPGEKRKCEKWKFSSSSLQRSPSPVQFFFIAILPLTAGRL